MGLFTGHGPLYVPGTILSDRCSAFREGKHAKSVDLQFHYILGYYRVGSMASHSEYDQPDGHAPDRYIGHSGPYS